MRVVRLSEARLRVPSFSLDFGLETTAGVYQVVALNTTTGCTDTMGSSATITINPLPSVYPVAGGGTYCSGGSGLSVGLGSSDAGIIYQLYDGTTATGFSVGGTGAAIGFGTFTATGTYTVSAINATSGCTTAMADSAVISVTALPTAYNMTGGGSYCAGGPGVDVGLDNSDTGVNYQLFNGATPVGSPIAGTGSALDLGFQTAAGTYTVEGVNATYGCSGAMAGSEIITITALVTPSVSVDVTADSVCAGTIVSYTALPVNAGPAPGYQWYVDGTPVSPFSTYSYAPASGDMVVITITSSDPCAAITTVSDTVSTSVTPLVTPAVTVTSSASDTICAGTPVTFTATGINGGSTPGYQWSVNGVTAGTGITYTYTPLNGDMVTSLLTSSAACATPDTASGTLVMTVADLATPVVTVSAAPGTALSASGTATFTATVVNGGSAPAYQWFVNGVPVPGATSATYISDSLVGDTIGCAVLNTDMCGSVGADSVIILHNVGVGQVVLSGMNIQLVPNPSSGTFTVRGNLGATQNMAVTLEITNMLGQNVFTKETTAQNGDINELIQLSNTLPNGMYILNIHSVGNNVVFHFVLKQ